MTEQEKFNQLLNEVGSRKELADYIGLELSSVNNQVAPGKTHIKHLPKWGKSMLYLAEKIKERKRHDLIDVVNQNSELFIEFGKFAKSYKTSRSVEKAFDSWIPKDTKK
jgi:hypothetical protein